MSFECAGSVKSRLRSQRSACLVLALFFVSRAMVLSIDIRLFTQVDGVAHQRLPINDISSSLCKMAGTARNIIDGNVASNRDNGRILVYCVADISRSPTVVAIYLKKRKGITLEDALEHIIHVPSL